MVINSVSQAARAALAAAVADIRSSMDRREGFLSRARRVATWRLRSGKGVRSSGVDASVVRLEMDASVVSREVVGVGKDVVTNGCEELVVRRPAEASASASSVDDADSVLVIAILAPVFSSDIVALLDRDSRPDLQRIQVSMYT